MRAKRRARSATTVSLSNGIRPRRVVAMRLVLSRGKIASPFEKTQSVKGEWKATEDADPFV